MTSAIASTNTLDLSPFAPSIQARREHRVSQSIRLAAVTDRSEDITFTTKEGDTVTLSLDQSTTAVYGRDGRISQIRQYVADADGAQTVEESLSGETREWFGIESSREFNLSVEGDLSREEITDIRKALRRIHHLMGGTFGVQDASTPGASGLAGLDTLDGIAVDIQESRFIMAARSTRVSALTYGTDAQDTSVPDALATSEKPAWQTVAEKAVGMVEETGIPSPHFARPLEHLFRHWAGVMRRRHRAFEPMVRMTANTVFEQLGIRPRHGVQGAVGG